MEVWLKKRLNEIAEFSPCETIKRGTVAKKIAMCDKTAKYEASTSEIYRIGW